MNIRKAKLSDLDFMLEIFNDSILNSTAVYFYQAKNAEEFLDWYNEKLTNHFPVFVAEENSKILGFASFGQFRPWPGYQYTVEHSLYVDNKQRGKGVGKILLNEIIEEAKKRGFHILMAGIDAENIPSLELHKKFGFEEVGHLKEVGWKFERWLDLKLLQLKI